MFAGKARQRQCFFACSGNLVEKAVDWFRAIANCLHKGALKTLAQGLPIGFAFQHKAVHPEVALFEHFNQQVFHLLPAVVAPQEQASIACAQGCVALSMASRARRAARRYNSLGCSLMSSLRRVR